MAAAPSLIGASIPRTEGPAKVTGQAVYAADLTLPGMLWGKVLRSPHPHARIVRVDAAQARQVPGVQAVVTGPDVPGHYWGKVLRDMPVLCWDRVRFVGDRVAAVAAETPEAAEAALALIDVEYEELPAVFDPLEAMEPNAPLLHDDISKYEGAPRERLATDIHNGVTRLAWTKGDPEQGFRAADVVLEHTFRIPARHQGYLEPHATLLDIQQDGRIQVWTSSKAPFRTRTQLAKAVGVPEERILVHAVFVGGDFGGKGDALDVPIAYFLACATGRPVKMIMSYGDELVASNPSHPTVVIIRSGVTRDGRILARVARTYHASGAYAAGKPNAALSTWHYVGGCYRVPNASFEFLQIATNTVPGGYFRAPGAHQFTFAVECHTDLLARELGMDPAEFRLKNIIGEGEEDAVGARFRTIKAREVLEAALDAADWKRSTPDANDAPPHPLPRGGEGKMRGRGIAMFGRRIGGGAGGAIVTAELDGTITVLSPTIDQGTGTHTIMKQLAADDMGLPLEQVRVVVGDTDTAPYDEGPRASRVTYTEGQAVLKACAELRERLTEPAAQLLDCREDEVAYRDGAFWYGDQQAGLGEVAARAGSGQPVAVTVAEHTPEQEDVTYFCAQVAEVEVDPETGQVRVDRLITAHDVGTIINPITHQGQIDGCVATGIGLALTEDLAIEQGRVTNAHLGDYKLPTVADMPPLETVLVPSAGGIGPHEAKAIGEFANNPPPAAIANAVADAVGVRLFDLPITAERVYNELRAGLV